MSEAKYIVGIDLGTTNSVVAYTEAKFEIGKTPQIHIFEVPQLVDTGSVEKREILPSFIFLPTENDLPKASRQLPWNSDNAIVVGELARNRGAEIPKRLISSSKSWLCNTLVDRNKPILPWEGDGDTSKKSPVEASSLILCHIRDAWNDVMAQSEKGPDKNLLLENQDIYLTVPASFDAVARDLTVKAAEMAGLKNVTLLEEPQAAFYSWIESTGDEWRKKVQKDDLVLICDVGGGTSDFSLIYVTEKEGDLVLERTAVGEHLLVGGDNMDLALAYNISQKMAKEGKKLDAWQMRGLWHSCRNAKEKMFSDSKQKKFPVTILGRGSSLIGGTIKTELTVKDVEDVIVQGFFPQCSIDDKPAVTQKVGIREIGLAYESDPSVTKHLARFVSQNLALKDDKKRKMPNKIMFNGGVMKSESIRKQITDTISAWSQDTEKEALSEITAHNFDLAVARGAAYYGIAKKGGGIRIRGGLSKSYYIGIAASMPAVPGMPIPLKAICVGPFGMEEGTNQSLEGQEFVLIVGESVKFDFLSSSIRFDDQIGNIIDDWESDIEKITTIETTLDGELGTPIPVNIEVKVTEIGTLELWCVSKENKKRWKLEFNVREKDK